VIVIARLHVRTLLPDQIAAYVRLDDPLDCAGSYKTESLGIALFESLECDDPTAIEGLPLITTCNLLREADADSPRRPDGSMSARPDDLEFARTMLPLVSRTFAPASTSCQGRWPSPCACLLALSRGRHNRGRAPDTPGTRNRWLLRFAGSWPIQTRRERTGPMRPRLPSIRIRPRCSSWPGSRLLRLLAKPSWRSRIAYPLDAGDGARMARFVLLEETSGDWTALGTLGDLEAYEYYVAGTVGCLLNDLIRLI